MILYVYTYKQILTTNKIQCGRLQLAGNNLPNANSNSNFIGSISSEARKVEGGLESCKICQLNIF